MLHESAIPPERVVVFDLDYTLTRWDTAARFFRWLLSRSPWRLAVVLCLAPPLSAFFLLPSTRKWPIRFAVWVATWGVDSSRLSERFEAHLHQQAGGPIAAIKPAALQRLRDHLARGDRVVVATGCVESLAVALLVHAGVGHVPVVGTSVRPFWGGLVDEQHCHGANKVRMLRSRGYAPPWSAAYTDHRVDLPLLALSSERYLVDPKPRCQAAIEQRLPSGVTVLSFR